MKKITWLIFSLCFQFVIVVGMVIKAMLPLMTGTAITLPVKGRDPRDIMRGNYVELSYDFNTLCIDTLEHDLQNQEKLYYGDILYLEMLPDGKFHKPVGIWHTFPEKNHGIPLKVSIQSPVTIIHRNKNKNTFENNCIEVAAGVEEYFANPKIAKAFEKHLNQRNLQNETLPESAPVLLCTMMIAPDGMARIKALSLAEK